MSRINRKNTTRFLRSAIVLSSAIAAICFGQSCNRSPNNDDGDTLKPPPWNQLEIDWSGTWSPDGSKIIYSRYPADGARDTSWIWGGFIHDVASGNDTCIWPNVKFTGFSWSPDGNRLAVNQNKQIFVYDFRDNSTQQITHENENFAVSWSPCGQKLIFFVKSAEGGLFVYDFDADSTMHVEGRHGSGSGDWLPDCSTLVLLDSCTYTECGVYAYNLYTDSLWFVTDVPGYKREISLSPDGETVVFGVDNDLWTANLSDGEPHRLTTEGGGYPDWSPDGQWIVYTKIDRRNGYLWLMRPDGSEKHQITF